MIPGGDDLGGDDADFDTMLTGEDAELPSEQMHQLIESQHSFEQHMAALSQQLVEAQQRLEQAVEFLGQQVTDVYQVLSQQLADGHEAHSQSQAALLAEIAKPKYSHVVRDKHTRVLGAHTNLDHPPLD